jgi:hypothetical protein
MKFSIGDKILLKQTGEEGTVTDFLGKEMLEVEVNGVHFPVYLDEVDHPYLKWFTEKNRQAKKAATAPVPAVEKEKDRQKRLPKGIYLSFMPVFKANETEDIVDQLKIFLLNETASAIRFSYDVRFPHASVFNLEGALHPFGHLYLHSINYADMNDQPRFHWTLSDAANVQYKREEGTLRIKSVKLFGHINDLLLKNEPTFSYMLVEDFVPKPKDQHEEKLAIPERIGISRPSKITSFADLPREEIDLHIEQLVPEWKDLGNAAIMSIQLRALERSVHLAIAFKQEKLIVIHGVGAGVLREAVHKILRNTPEVKSFRNEYMAKYGFGATEVFFRR